MTQLLKIAFGEASKLSPADQDDLAKQLLDALRSEEKWGSAFTSAESRLDELADDALREYRSGLTEDLDPEKL